jgi:hypothetical protein
MKATKLIILIILGLGVACGWWSSPEESRPSSSPLATPVGTFFSPPATPIPAQGQPGEVAWNPDPAAVIISASFCCGFVPEVVRLNYLADATVWGNGRIIWTEYAGQERQVWQGQLSPEQLRALLSQAQQAGFFNWEDRYADNTVADAAEKCLSIRLLDQSKQVCEYFKGAPEAFHQLYALVTAGAGANGAPYLPQRAYLTALPLPGGGSGFVADEQWSAQTMGFSLSQATAGRWVEGPALQSAWQRVNRKWSNPLVQEESAYFQIALQLPGLSLLEPPQ